MAVNFYSEVHFADNVGIGTTSPAKKLHVLNSTNEAQIRLGQSGSGSYDIGVYSGDKFSIGRDADTQEFTLSGGNVGIGTTSPGSTLDVNGDTNITGHLDVTASSASGSPLIRFNQTTTRRGFIQMADTNNNLRVASEYGSVSLEAASSGGSDSDTSYIRIQPGGTVEIGAVDGDATIATDGNMTFRIDADNDETSQKFAFQNNASTEIASLDESGNLSLDGGIELGNASDTTIARSAAGKVTIEGAPIQTTQIVTSHHNMSLDGSSSTVDYYFPINSLADGSSSSLYYTRVLPAYDGKLVKMLFRASNVMGSSCTIYMSRRAHDGTSTSHQTSSFQASETFDGSVKSTVIVPCGVGGSNAADWVFEEGDQLGFSLVKNTTATNVDLTVTIVYEYTIS